MLRRVLTSCLVALFFGCGAAMADAIDVKWQEAGKRLTITTAAKAQQKAGFWWFDAAGLLRAVHHADLPSGEANATVTLPSGGRWAALSGGRLEVFVYGRAGAAQLKVDARPDTKPAGKPMAHGALTQAEQSPGRWFVTDDHTLVWDGEPWIPFGGMFCSPVLSFYDKTTLPIAKRWQMHAEALDQIQAAGFNELYLNLAHGPIEVRQQVVDDLNRRGIRFGWQLPGEPGPPLKGYHIRRNTGQGLLIGTCEQPGQLRVRLPKENLQGLLIVGVDDNSVRNVTRAMNLADPAAQIGFIQIDEVTDATAKVVGTTVTVDGLPLGKYYVIPTGIVKAHARDAWGHAAEIARGHAWVKQIKWGAGLRFFVDPITNEDGLYNQAEPVRVWTKEFNADYARWLERRYGTVEALAEAWRLPPESIESFAHAARLVPLRDSDADWGEKSVRWIDPVALRQIATLDGVGQGWLDYVEGVRDTYAACRDEVARELKKLVNVPVVFKRVAPWVNAEAICRSPGGFDGVGLELYPGNGSFINQGLCSGAVEAKLSAQTSWLMSCELGYFPATNNGGRNGFPSEQHLKDHLIAAAAFGAKGFMFFGWRLEPYDIWKPMQLHAQPEQLAWIANARKHLVENWPQAWPMAQAYPEGENWWWKSGNQRLSRYSAVLDGGVSLIKQSVALEPAMNAGPALWAVTSTPIFPDAVVRLVNFATAESAERYGPQAAQWIARGEKVIYVGPLPAGGKAAGLDKHFTPERSKIDEDELQVLQVHPGDKVLAEHDGKPWAKRSGNLLVVGRWSPMRKSNSNDPLSVVDPQWVRDLLAGDEAP